MFSKTEIKKGDEICFNGGDFLTVFDITDKYLTVGVNKNLKKALKLDTFRVVKINGRYYAYTRLDSVLK